MVLLSFRITFNVSLFYSIMLLFYLGYAHLDNLEPHFLPCLPMRKVILTLNLHHTVAF